MGIYMFSKELSLQGRGDVGTWPVLTVIHINGEEGRHK